MNITIEQLEQLNEDNYNLPVGYIIIFLSNDKFEVYSTDQAEDSDPDPIFTGTAQEIVTYFKNK